MITSLHTLFCDPEFSTSRVERWHVSGVSDLGVARYQSEYYYRSDVRTLTIIHYLNIKWEPTIMTSLYSPVPWILTSWWLPVSDDGNLCYGYWPGKRRYPRVQPPGGPPKKERSGLTSLFLSRINLSHPVTTSIFLFEDPPILSQTFLVSICL